MTAHELIDSLTSALTSRRGVNVSADHGGPIALEFALNRAVQSWDRIPVAEMAGQIAAGVAATHGLTTAEARELSDMIAEGLRQCGDDQHAGREWLRGLRGYAVRAAKEAA